MGRRWCFLEENKKIAEIKNKDGEETKGQPIRMNICKRPALPGDHLKKAGGDDDDNDNDNNKDSDI